MTSEPVEQDLLAAIASEPDAIEPRVIYGDWLQSREDPRGELIMVQAARMQRPDDAELVARETELLTQITARLFENVPPIPVTIRSWYLGFVDSLEVPVRAIKLLRNSHREWFWQPVFAQIRELDVDSRFARNLRFIRDTPLGKTVRRLHFGETDETLDDKTVPAIVREVPNAEELHLRCADVPDLRLLAALPLKRLSLEVLALADRDFERILTMPWKLERFALTSRLVLNETLYPNLASIFDGTMLPSIKHFEVGGNIPLMEVIDTIGITRKPGEVDSFTANFSKLPYGPNPRLEKHKEAFAKIAFKALLVGDDNENTETCAALGAFLNHRMERAEDALAAYEQALKIKPEHQNARHGMGIALRKLKRNDESLVAFDTIINASKSPTAEMFNGRHYTLCELGRRADAKADLERAVKLNPQYADAWNNLGCERQYAGEVDGALEAFRRTMQIDTEHGYGRRNEGELLLEVGRAEEARPIFAELLERKPSDSWLLTLRAQCEVELGEAKAAIATIDLRLADPSDDNRNRSLVLRALAYQQLPNPASMTRDLDGALSGTDCPAWVALITFVRAASDRATWTRVIGDALVTPKDIADAMYNWAKATRPDGAEELHEVGVGDQLDCSEIAILEALRSNNRDLAVRRAHAAAALFKEQGPTFFRKWWHTYACVSAVTARSLDEPSRALLTLVTRATRGREPIDTLANVT